MKAKVKDYSKDILKEKDRAKRKALRGMAELLEERAKETVRVRSGETRDTVRHEIEGDEARVGTNYFIGRLLETGTINMRAFPWLSIAIETNKSELRAIAKEAFE